MTNTNPIKALAVAVAVAIAFVIIVVWLVKYQSSKSSSNINGIKILEDAFTSGFMVNDKTGQIGFEKILIGMINLRSGKLIACDALTDSEFSPFKLEAPIGQHPVEISIAKIGNDERIAFARIRFSSAVAVKWQIALSPGQELSKLKEGEIFGYGVDSGTGSFMDSMAAESLAKKIKSDDSYFDDLIKAMETNYKDTRDWAVVGLDNNDIALFSSGYGDGFYASYWGYAADGSLVSITTDFGIVDWK